MDYGPSRRSRKFPNGRMIIVFARLPMEFSTGLPGGRIVTKPIPHLPKGLPPFNGKGRILMKRTPKHRRPWRKWLVAPALLLAVLAMSGCKTLSYYGQAIKGQYQIVAHEQKIKKL